MADVPHFCSYLAWAVLALTSTLSLGHSPPTSNRTETSSPLFIHFTHARVVRGVTRNLALTCERGTHPGSSIKTLYWLRLLKKLPDGWSLVAQQRDLTDTQTYMDHVTAVGELAVHSGNGYLQARWEVADESTFGVYQCDALGMDNKLQFVIEKSSEFAVSEHNVSTKDMLDLLMEDYIETKRQTQKMAGNVQENSSLLKHLLERMTKLERELEEHVHQTADEGSDSEHNESISWPGGHFGLLMPELGCPENSTFHPANSSYIKFHREADSNETCDNHNPHFHLSKPVNTATDSDCFINLRFCEAAEVTSTTPWPDGSYCINWNIDYPCPPQFHPGRVVLDQVDGTLTHEVNSGVVELSGTYTYLHFCCKSTLPHDSPMVLPTESPFYLYRYGGTCQQVYGMEVTPEYIDIDTEDRINGDSTHGRHADINIERGQPTTIELCYYSKRS